MKLTLKNLKLCIVGLGYVGLPLAVNFGQKRYVIGFDLNKLRIRQLKKGFDSTNEMSKVEILKSKKLEFVHNTNKFSNCNCFIVTVPTPIKKNKTPDLSFIKYATEIIARKIKKNSLIIYESTVYPGLTEEYCAPIIENISKLKFNKDFFLGYSPERINPGDKKHNLKQIVKITSGSTKEISYLVDKLYKTIISAGTYLAPSIKVAEAAKVIENTQRDLNIGLINELSIIFNKLNINTYDVLEAAKTKWNFISFQPGLVGGHCIGVDPYYLTYKSKKVGYKPKIILSARKLNNSMSNFVSKKIIKKLNANKKDKKLSKILIMGITFKENCSDIRNSKVFDVYKQLKTKIKFVDTFDPLVNVNDLKNKYQIKLLKKPKTNYYDIIIIAVGHKFFENMGIKKIKKFGKKNSVIFDLKNVFKNQKDESIEKIF